MDDTETTKLLGKVKDPNRRRASQLRLERVFADVANSSLGALVAVARCGLLHFSANLSVQPSDLGAKELKRQISEWAFAAEKKERAQDPRESHAASCAPSRWILATNFSGLVDTFLDKAYSVSASESGLYVQALSDQFIESPVTSRGSRMPSL
ncbi:hypothetical protein OY671_011630, partial [Metschnikowia pulcherrima]